jgi:hypothetical protein
MGRGAVYECESCSFGWRLYYRRNISKLRRSSLGRSFDVVDMCQSDPLLKIEALRPDVIVVDGNDPNIAPS